MDDMISRAAAIDAIVSATVFPDAEYIKNLCQNPANSEDWLGGVCDAINAVEDVNTVDAIPVEWLKQQRECNDPESVKDINGAFVSICIDGVLMLWQKEQEAR